MLDHGRGTEHRPLAEGGREHLDADGETRRRATKGTLIAGWPARFDGIV